MIFSMTGFGQGEAANAHSTVTVEVRSVNHRFLDIAFKLPRSLQNREPDIKEIVRGKIARGRVSITIAVESSLATQGVAINENVLEQYLTQLRAFAMRHNIDDHITLDALVTLPEVVTTKEVGKGTGLGLAVCRGLVEAVGGTITLDASVAKGARFVLELPRAKL